MNIMQAACNLFIDLEETIIDSCDSCRLLLGNLERIKQLVLVVNPAKIETFSWGLWSLSDFQKWEQTRLLIQKDWGLNIDTQNFDIEAQHLAFLRSNIGKVEKNEVIDFCGLLKKETVFEWHIRKQAEVGHFILIDDRVLNKRIELDFGNIIIDFININQIDEWTKKIKRETENEN